MDGCDPIRLHHAGGCCQAVDVANSNTSLPGARRRDRESRTGCRKLPPEGGGRGSGLRPEEERHRKAGDGVRSKPDGFLRLLLGLPARRAADYRFEEGMEGEGYSASITDRIPPLVLNSPVTLA